MKRLLLIISTILITVSGYSQIKFEKEERIKKYEVPEKALALVESMNLTRKIKWFKETSFTGISIEAKTKFNGKRLSIEFSEEGILEDIEVEIEKEEVPKHSIKKICEYFKNTHHKYKIDKIQKQYSGDTNLIIDYFLSKVDSNKLIIKYEIVITTKEDGEFCSFEYLFDENGVFIQKSRIQLKMTDNIEF